MRRTYSTAKQEQNPLQLFDSLWLPSFFFTLMGSTTWVGGCSCPTNIGVTRDTNCGDDTCGDLWLGGGRSEAPFASPLLIHASDIGWAVKF